MREIKFRCWNQREKAMSGQFRLTDISAEGAVVGGEKSYIGDITGKDGEVELMQSTGLKDKNGNEIYADDLWFKDGCTYICQWTNAYAGFNLVAIELNNKHTGEILPMFHAKEGEVIGNIYQNKDLLNG